MPKSKIKMQVASLLVIVLMGWWATISVLPLHAQLANSP